MKKETSLKLMISSGLLVLVAGITLGSYATVTIFNTTTQGSEDLTGKVGLRSYFETGIGTEDKPFVISRPIHFYNLTRLQNLGVFNKVYYFQLGYDPDGGTNYRFYKNNSSDTMISYLDMSTMSDSNFLSIGSEGNPFYGNFNGKGLVVKNLHVHAGPEDVGVFGYTYTGSKVHDVYFESLKVSDDGYDTGVTGLSAMFTTTSYGSLSYGTDSLSSTQQKFTDTTKTFTATFPTELTGVSYELRSSSEYLTVNNSDGTSTATINQKGVRTSLYDNDTFTGTSGNRISLRLSIIATLFDSSSGISYSKVLSTYLLTFVNTITSGTSTINFRGEQDYVESTQSTDYTQYAHGTNIGFLIGHCDGSASNCYVHNGTMSLNNGTDGSPYKHVAQETETGMIGEVGPAIKNEYGKKIAAAQNGDTGVVNFTKMFNDVAGSSTFTLNSSEGVYEYTPTDGNVFNGYLRHNFMTGTSKKYVSKASNSVDFLGQQMIEDTPEDTGQTAVDRGLGVFKLVTSSKASTSNSTYKQGIGDFAVSKYSNNKTYTSFWYTTAEYDDLDPASSTRSITDWGYNSNYYDLSIQAGRYLPTWSDANTWNPTFEKHFNYVFRCDLASDSDAQNANYFKNTDSTFLKNYLNYKLIDKNGDPISSTSNDYGIFIKNVDTVSKETTNITTFSSYLNLSAPSDAIYSIVKTVDDVKMPANTINFSISNAKGANVTVLATSNNTTGGYVSIYDKSKILTDTMNVKAKNPALHPSYTMYCPYLSSARDDTNYFDFNVKTGVTEKVSKPMSTPSANNLYAHTFKLPKGDYFISSPNGSANIMYVCAQGQGDKGNYGNQSNYYSPINTLVNIDFLAKDPSASGYTFASTDRCFLTFEGTFDTNAGDLSMASTQTTTNDVIDNKTVFSCPSNLLTFYLWNDSKYTFKFGDNDTSNLQYFAYKKNGG